MLEQERQRPSPRRGYDRRLRRFASATSTAYSFWVFALPIIAIGATLRAVGYLADRSLWLDEAYSALDITGTSFRSLIDPLPFNQGLPIGFVGVESLASALAGRSEYALRLPVLIAGLGSLALFAVIARRVLQPAGAAFAFLLFAVADGPVYFASELKPYAFDLLATLVLTLSALVLVHGSLGRRSALALAALGVVSVTVSYAALIAAPALAAVVSVRALARPVSRLTVAVLVAWLAATLAFGLLARHQLVHLRQTILAASAPVTVPRGQSTSSGLAAPTALASVKHFTNVQADLLGLPHGSGGLALPGIGFSIVAVAGLAGLWRRRPQEAVLLASPLVTASVLIAANQYPLLARTSLFLLPLLLLLVGSAVDYLWARRARGSRTIGILVALAILAIPVRAAGHTLLHPRHFQELRPALAYLRDHWRPGDALYVYYSAQYAFTYYGECECLDMSRRRRMPWPVERVADPGTDQFAPAARSVPPDVYIGGYFDGDWPAYLRDLSRVRGRSRVWFVFTHASTRSEARFEYERLPHYLDRIGLRLGTRIEGGARVYLYDLSRSKPSVGTTSR